MQNKADTELVRRQNRGLVLEALRRAGPLARVELGRTTGLSPATISAITADLIGERLLVAAELDAKAERPTGRGRPRVALTLNPGAAYVLGVKVSLGLVTLILSDFAGRLVDKSRIPIETMGPRSSEFATRLAESIRGFLQERDIPLAQVAEIPVAMPGAIDSVAGTLLWSPTFSATDVQILEPLREALGTKCSMANDVDMIALALNSRNPARFGRTFAVVFISYGVGMGLFIDGRLFSGAFGTGAEFGHSNHIPGGALCRCGRRGCVEAYVADYAIQRAIESLPPDMPPAEIDPDPELMRRYEERGRAGDEKVRIAYHQAGLALGYGVSRLVALLNPERVAFTGRGIAAFDLMEAGFKIGLEEGLVADLRKMTEMEVLSDDRELVDVGMLAGALRRLDREIFASSDHPPVPVRG